MTPLHEHLASLRQLAEGASPEPWHIGYKDGSGAYSDEGKFCLSDGNDDCVLHARLADSFFDARFIAASRTAVPRLCAALEIALVTLHRYGQAEQETEAAYQAGHLARDARIRIDALFPELETPDGEA